MKKAKKKRIFNVKSEIFFMNDSWDINTNWGSVLLHTLNGVLHTKRRRAKNDLTLHTVCKIFKEKKLKIGKI